MTQVAASWPPEWEKPCWIGSILVYILCFYFPRPLILLPTSFFWNCETVAKRLWCRGVGDWASPPRLPPRLFTMYDLQHIMPPTPSSPFYQSRREGLTHVCIASSVTTIGLGSFVIYELASFKRAEKKKCLFVGLTFFFVIFILFFSFTKKRQTMKKREQIKCGGDVPKPSWNQVL